MKYFLGVDAGGTSTRFVLFNDLGEALDTLELESIHYMKVDDKTMKQLLEKAKNHFIKEYDAVEMGVAMGVAGYGSNLKVRKRIEDVVYSVFPEAVLTNDAQFAMISALNNQDGIYIISGTGSIAFRIKEGIDSRRGGYGYLVGDEGSGFWIGKKILEQFTQEADGRLQRTDCYNLIMKHFQLDTAYAIVDLASEQGNDYRTWCASFAGLLKDVESVQSIYHDAGVELSRLVNSFDIKKETKIAFGGSVLSNHKTVQKALKDNLDKNFIVLEHEHEIEYSAYLQLKTL